MGKNGKQILQEGVFERIDQLLKECWAKLTEDLEVKALFELKTTLVYFTQQRFCLQYILHAYEDEVQHKPNTSA